MKRKGSVFASVLTGLVVLSLAGSAMAAPGCGPSSAECPPLLGQFGSYGAGPGEIENPRGIAADPTTGHIYVAESENGRVSEFTPQGGFVKAWGWGVIDGTSLELQVCTLQTGCAKGIEGSGAGQLNMPVGIEVDEQGFVWTLERETRRAQKFSPSGEFVLMIGGEVNKTRVKEREAQEANAEPVTVTEAQENLCTAASGDECGGGTSGTGQGQFQALRVGNPIALGPGGTIYIGDNDRVQKFEEDGTYLGDIPLPGAGGTRSLTVDPTGRLYVISENVFEKISNGLFEVNSWVVREIGPAGEEISRLYGQWQGRKTPKDPIAVEADADGNVYVIGRVVYDVPVNEGEEPKWEEIREVVAFDDEGNLISFKAGRAGFGAPSDTTEMISVATNVVGDGSGTPGEVLVGHFDNGNVSGVPKSYIRSYGVPFELSEGEPSVADQYVLGASDEEAVVEGLINPRFTSDTTYQVQYGTGICSAGGCGSVAPTSPASLGGGAVNSPLKTGPVTLQDLEPGTTYHYRFVAQNSAGGPVFGAEGTFRTFASPAQPPYGCLNEALRSGTSVALPDCRAYEMVSPVNKEGGEFFSMRTVSGYPALLNQASVSGKAVTFSSYRAFANSASAPYTSQYLAERHPPGAPGEGWISHSISPLREGVLFPTLETQFRAFSEDLALGWLVSDSEPVLAAGGLPGYRNLYRRDNVDETYQAQCPVEPDGTAPPDFNLEPMGFSSDGNHLIFRATGKLTPDAAAGGLTQLYECVGGTQLRLVSVLPNEEASPTGGSAGTARGSLNGDGFRENNVDGAVSTDGSRIFWTAAAQGPGPLYVRIEGDRTIQIAAGGARFRAASPDGTKVLYTVGEELREASIGNETAVSTTIAGDLDGVMGASEDVESVYFVSQEDLDGGGAAQAGDHNLYLYKAQGETYTFIAELSGEDVREVFAFEEDAPVLTPVSLSPYNRSSRVTDDGLHAAFTSTAPLTGYDNTDQASGKALAEVFLYDAEVDALRCVSCNPTGARPQGANVGIDELPYWVAAKIPGWGNQLQASRALAEDGNRLFFEAVDNLALGDTNGVQDVYQWEAVGTGSCRETSSTYSAENGGCVDLISSGKSPQASRLVDASGNGDDVFFATTQSLWAPDPGLWDIYDARVNGGFTVPPSPQEPCEGSCQNPGPPPPNQAPPTSTFVGPGDTPQMPKPKRCRKGTHKVRKAGRVRCVKNKKVKRHTSRGSAR